MPAVREIGDGGPTREQSGTVVFRHIVSKSPNPIAIAVRC